MKRARKFILALAILGALAVPGRSDAGFWDGNKLKTLVDANERMDMSDKPSDADIQETAMLIGLVVGVHDTLVATQIICAQDNVKVRQLIGIVKKYVRDNPGKWDKSAAILITSALSSSFPCKR